MKIQKVYIKNFKGIQDKKIIDFDESTTILIGPNGFGKTTIYDVLELCFTGSLHRTDVKKSVTSDSRDYIKPFYQNQSGKDVIIKVWIKNEYSDTPEDSDLIIVKYLSKDHTGRSNNSGRKNKPSDFGLMKTYRDVPERFEDDEFTPQVTSEINDKTISNFLGLERDGDSFSSLYRLFNYIQQEETTYFLKKSEKERKSALGFLLQTEDHESELERINVRITKFEGILIKLNDEIKRIPEIQFNDKPIFENIFPDKDIAFDKELLYQDIIPVELKETRDLYISQIDKIINFKKIFLIAEYRKKQASDNLDKLNDYDFLSFYALKNLISPNEIDKIKEEWQLVKNEIKHKVYILQLLIPNIIVYKDHNIKYDKYKKFSEIDSFESKIEEVVNVAENIQLENSDNFKILLMQRSNLKQMVDVLESSIKEIVQSRNKINEELGKMSDEMIGKANCPYCGYEWGTLETLKSCFEKKALFLEGLLSDQSLSLINIEEELEKNYVIPIQKEINDFLEKESKIEEDFIAVLEGLKNFEVDNRIPNLLNSNDHVWKTPSDMKTLTVSLKSIKTDLMSKVTASEEVYNKIQSMINVDFSEYLKLIKALNLQGELDKFIIFSQEKQIDQVIQNDAINAIRDFIQELKCKYSYNHEQAKDEDGFYNKYFDEDENKFNGLQILVLEMKKQYVDFMLFQNQSSILINYKRRYTELHELVKNLKSLKDVYSKTITKYKCEMVERIKLPFYIYSAKILQNYQQGMGVFLATKENSDTIRFLTDPTTDHDAVHHLSSGQLAVISLAFTLAINKTYNVSKELKCLMIDDPIQEMDALNIHSFVELIRHDFLNEYQLIFSTHNDINAVFMKYKFEKISEKTVSLINVQDSFFE